MLHQYCAKVFGWYMGKNFADRRCVYGRNSLFHSWTTCWRDNSPFLVSLTDGLVETLRVVIARASVSAPGTKLPDPSALDARTAASLEDILSASSPIEPNENKAFELCFKDYILCLVKNESYSVRSPEDRWSGRYLRIYDRSQLLDILPDMTIAQRFDDGGWFPGPWVHYGICTQCHIIDIITHMPPVIKKLT